MIGETMLTSALIGAGATALTDLWNTLLRRSLHVSSLNLCMLGRWVCHLRRGVFRHASITSAPSCAHECGFGWVIHYAIGAALAVGFVWLVGSRWLQHPTALAALVFGECTTVFPFLILQPALGLGIASSQAPSPWRARLKSIGTHTVFGFGLYVMALTFKA